MKIPKSKLGFLLAGVYVFIAILVLVYANFVCDMPEGLYLCGIIAFMPAFPLLLLTAIFSWIFLLPAGTLDMIVNFFVPVLINVVLAYFVGSLIQKKFSSKVTQIVGIGAIIIAIAITEILGARYFNKSDIFENNISTNVNNQINSRDYCRQDSDCVLVPQYQGCCTKGCEIEAVNVETKNRDEEARDKQYNCNLKKINCPQHKCVSSVDKQAVCEQNRCVVKEKSSVQTKLQEFEVKQIADVYAGAKGYNLSEYQAPEITYDSKTNEWYLFYDQVYPPRNEIMPDKHFGIYINDDTGEVLRLMPGN